MARVVEIRPRVKIIVIICVVRGHLDLGLDVETEGVEAGDGLRAALCLAWEVTEVRHKGVRAPT